jgi:hypothetical protein
MIKAVTSLGAKLYFVAWRWFRLCFWMRYANISANCSKTKVLDVISVIYKHKHLKLK